MGIPVDELQDRVSSRRFAEYWAYHQIAPFGPEREDLRMATVAMVIANVNRNPKKRPRPYTAADFMPAFEAAQAIDEEELTDEERAERVDALMAELGGEGESETFMRRRES